MLNFQKKITKKINCSINQFWTIYLAKIKIEVYFIIDSTIIELNQEYTNCSGYKEHNRWNFQVQKHSGIY